MSKLSILCLVLPFLLGGCMNLTIIHTTPAVENTNQVNPKEGHACIIHASVEASKLEPVDVSYYRNNNDKRGLLKAMADRMRLYKKLNKAALKESKSCYKY